MNRVRFIAIRYAKPQMMMMVAPVGMFAEKEIAIPLKVKTMPRPIAEKIMACRVRVYKLAIAAGKLRSAMTRIMPTIWISTTIVSAIIQSNKIYKKSTGRPRNRACSSSYVIAMNCL